MKKITSLFVMLLLTIVSATRVSAQLNFEDFGMTPVITDVSQLSSPCSDSEEGLDLNALIDNNAETFWHTDWHNAFQGEHHYLDISLPEPTDGYYVLWLVRRNVGANHPTEFTIEGSTDGENFHVVADTVKVACSGAGKTDYSAPWLIKEAVTHLRLVVQNASPAYNKFWHTAELQLYHGDENSVIAYLFQDILASYDEVLWASPEEYGMGDGINQYSDYEAYEAFKAGVKFVDDWVAGLITDPITLEEAQAKIDEINANHQKLMDSKIPPTPYKIENGYYRIMATMEYTKTEPVVDENGEPVIDPETGEQTSVTTHPAKAMYTNGDNLNWKTFDENDATFLFRFDNTDVDGKYLFKSATTEGRLDTIATSGAVMLDKTLDPMESAVALSFWKRDEEKGRDVLVMSRYDQNKGYLFLHQGGHSAGAGESGNIVGWETTDASLWYVVRVEDTTAEAMIAEWKVGNDRETMLANVSNLCKDGKAKLKIAADYTSIIDKESPLVTDGSQFSSPFTTTDAQKIDESTPATEADVYNFLLDGNPATYWHSKWENGAQPGGTHYLQVELTDPAAVQNAAIEFTRRNSAADDHITEWGVYGTNEAEAEKDACEELDILFTPFSNNSETLSSSAFPTKGYKYIRFYINNTVGSGITATRGYGHMAEFQMYPAVNEESPTSQKAMLGALYTNLEAAIAAVPTNKEEITVEHYNKLQEAYNAFMEKFVDPAALRNAIATAGTNAGTFVEGTLPGFWTAGANASLLSAIETANAYDKGGAYTAEKSEELIAQLETESDNFFASANKVSTNKWYHLGIASEEMYDEYGWPKSNVTDETTGLGNLFGQQVTAGTIEQPEGDNNDVISPLDSEDVLEGTAMFFTDAPNGDGSMFRFINVGDTAYVIQNRATSLYVNCAAANSTNVTLSLVPSIFKVRAIGCGQLVFAANSLNGENLTNLHAQKAAHRLVTWSADNIGSNSGLMVEEIEDVDVNNLTNTFARDVRPGEVSGQCYPVPVSAEEGMYAVAGTYTQNEKNYVALSHITEAKAGQPFVYINGVPGNYTEPAEGEEVATVEAFFSVGHEVVAEPNNTDCNGLTGTFSTIYVEKGTPVFVKNGAEAAEGEDNTECTRKVNANKAYLLFGETTVEPGEGKYDLVIEITGEVTAVSIQETLDKVAKSGNVYDLSGRLVRRNATLNEVKAMGRGMYILNGTKIIVK